MTFQSFPIILFYRLLLKGDEFAIWYLNRYHRGTSWDKIKTKWEIETRDDKGDPIFEKHRQIVILTAQLAKYKAIYVWMNNTKRDVAGLLKEVGVSLPEDESQRNKAIEKEIKKITKKIELTSKEIDRLKGDEKDEEGEVELDIQGIYDGIAALDFAGFHIEDYDKLTIGKYLAMTKVAKERIQSTTHG